MKKKTGFDIKTVRRILREIKHYRIGLFFSLLFAAASVALTLYIPILTGDAIDLMIGKDRVDAAGVIKIAILIGICTLGCALLQWVMNVINNIGFVIIAAFGGYFALNGMISVGVISAFIVYAKQFGRPINEIAQLLDVFPSTAYRTLKQAEKRLFRCLRYGAQSYLLGMEEGE